MKKMYIPLILILLGSILTVTGANSYFAEADIALCTACGMKVSKTDPSTLIVKTSDGQNRYACCPVCAGVVGLFCQNSSITGKCYNCKSSVSFQVKSTALASFSPAQVVMLSGGSCTKNKLACTASCESDIKASNDWAKTVSTKTSTEFFAMAQTKLNTMTITDKPDQVSVSVYAILGLGIILLLLAPLSWLYLRKK